MTQFPAPLPVTMLPLSVQIVAAVTVLNVTGRPELAVAVQVLVPFILTEVGVQDRVMVWLSLLTVMLFVTGVAALNFASPA